MNGVQTRFKCKLDVKRCKRFVFPPSSLLPRSNALKTKAIRYFQTDRTLTRIVSPPLPDAIENEDIIVVEVPEEENNERQDTEKETARKNPKPCNMPECDSNFRQKYLVNTPMPGRIQVYLNRKLYDEIKNYLHVIAPEVSIASYISNIIAEHIELNIEEITRMYKDRFSPPKIQ